MASWTPPRSGDWGWAVARVSVRRVVTLICAGWVPHDGVFGRNFSAGLEIERGPLGCSHGACRGSFHDAAVTASRSSRKIRYSISFEHGHGPAPAGELAGDRGIGDHGPLAAIIKGQPTLIQALVALIAAPPSLGRGVGPATS